PTASRALGDHEDDPDDTPRQFVFSDGHGGVEKIRVDLEGPHLAHLREALDTNPDARRAHLPVPPRNTAPPAREPGDEHPGLGGTARQDPPATPVEEDSGDGVAVGRGPGRGGGDG
ncbi:MAG: hypothetical protein QOE59_4323, partial [Actinomycetota bacterium]|nr:hypothetical protein [Actinomycetota bacterium]